MKPALALLLVLAAAASVLAQDEAWNYLGEPPPDDLPKRFPLSTTGGFFAAERIAISHDRQQLYFTELNGYSATSINRLFAVTHEDGKWSAPATVYSGKKGPASALNTPVPDEWRWGPYVTDDGKYLFFTRQSFLGVVRIMDTHIEWVRFDRLRERLERESR